MVQIALTWPSGLWENGGHGAQAKLLSSHEPSSPRSLTPELCDTSHLQSRWISEPARAVV